MSRIVIPYSIPKGLKILDTPLQTPFLVHQPSSSIYTPNISTSKNQARDSDTDSDIEL